MIDLPISDWLERFGFAGGLLLLVLFGLYRLAKSAINKVGGEVKEWLAEQTAFVKELRSALPSLVKRIDSLEADIQHIRFRCEEPRRCPLVPSPVLQPDEDAA